MAKLPDDIIRRMNGEGDGAHPPHPPHTPEPLDPDEVLEVREIAEHMGDDGDWLLSCLETGDIYVSGGDPKHGLNNIYTTPPQYLEDDSFCPPVDHELDSYGSGAYVYDTFRWNWYIDGLMVDSQQHPVDCCNSEL